MQYSNAGTVSAFSNDKKLEKKLSKSSYRARRGSASYISPPYTSRRCSLVNELNSAGRNNNAAVTGGENSKFLRHHKETTSFIEGAAVYRSSENLTKNMNHRQRSPGIKKDEPEETRKCGSLSQWMNRGNQLIQLVVRIFRFIVQYLGGDDEQGNIKYFYVSFIEKITFMKNRFFM